MSLRQWLNASQNHDPQQLLSCWRKERSYRVGRGVCYVGILLALMGTLVDWFSDTSFHIFTDSLLLLGCGITLFWIRADKRPVFYWWPAYFGVWGSCLALVWNTGGMQGPFFGIFLALMFVFGAMMASWIRPIFYFLFVLIHIPGLYAVEKLWLQPPPVAVTSLVTAAILSILFSGIYLFVRAILSTEKELSLEFAEHFDDLLATKGELKRSEALLTEAQEIGGVGSWEWDIVADKVTWSDGLYKIFEVSRQSFVPSFESYLERQDPAQREKIEDAIQAALITGKDYTYESEISTSAGKKCVSSRGRVIRNESGRPVKLVGVCQDISERKQIESQLKKAQTELEERVEERTIQLAQSLEREREAKKIAENASQAKMQFLANMSHEIRTPMSSILGYSDLLDTEDNTPEESREYIKSIITNGNQLLHLIDDILDLSKFEAGQIPLEKHLFAMGELLKDIERSFQPALEARGIELQFSFSGEPVEEVVSDDHRLKQILCNIVGNAIKFSEKGKVSVDVQFKKLKGRKIRLRVDVKDEGVGIPPASQAHLFLPFSQGDNSTSRRFGGSGLGLVLSRRLAEALGGSLELVSSQEGVGSHFRFEAMVESPSHFQAELPVAEWAVEDIQSKFFEKTILLAEDFADIASLVSLYLKPLGCHIDVAPDGLKAMEMASQKSYDCILMDIHMPKMDGLAATRAIRKSGYKNPILALTAHALPAEVERSFDAGCDLHLTKPIDRVQLISTMAGFL